MPKELVKALRGKPTISSEAIRLYLTALVQLKIYEEYFSVASDLINVVLLMLNLGTY